MHILFTQGTLSLLFVFLALPGVIVMAQEEETTVDQAIGFPGDPPMPSEEGYQQTEEELEALKNSFTRGREASACFDYYTFQSVQVQLGLDKDAYAPGETVSVYGDLVNENPYPVVDGNVFVRVARDNENYMQEGYYVIDEFIAIPNVAIDANSSIEGMYTWTVPQGLPSGEYRFDYFFSVGKKFNLGGLPFSNEVVIGMATFSVEGEAEGTISFDRANTLVNDEPYKHVGNWPIVEPGEKVTITQPLTSAFTEDTDISVTYDLYYWDSLDPDDLIDSQTETVTLSGGETTDLTYTIPSMDEPVYYLKITATTGTQQSIVNIRIVSNQERPRLNYPAITQFPLEAGDAFTLFTCFHNTANVDTEGKVVVTLTDRDGNVVGTTEHEGAIRSAMDFVKNELTAEKEYTYLTLTAEVYDKDGTLVDSYETVYDCALLNSCIEKVQQQPTPAEPKTGLPPIVKYLSALALLLIVGFLTWYVIRSTRKTQTQDSDMASEQQPHYEQDINTHQQ